jgi:hypothetical protein
VRSLRLLTVAAVAAATLTATAVANASTNTGVSASKVSLWQQATSLRSGISWHRRMTWQLEDRAGVARTPTEYAERHIRSVSFLRWDDRLWAKRHAAAKHLVARARTTIHVALWLCIHKGEGAWNDDTGNGYYGGLQMTSGWGGVARPDLLSPQAQMALAERGLQAAIRKGDEIAWLEGQWPNTSPPCLGYA